MILKCTESGKVEIITEDDGIKIKKITIPEKRKNIYELLKNFDGTYKKEDIDWGEPKGNGGCEKKSVNKIINVLNSFL